MVRGEDVLRDAAVNDAAEETLEERVAGGDGLEESERCVVGLYCGLMLGARVARGCACVSVSVCVSAGAGAGDAARPML